MRIEDETVSVLVNNIIHLKFKLNFGLKKDYEQQFQRNGSLHIHTEIISTLRYAVIEGEEERRTLISLDRLMRIVGNFVLVVRLSEIYSLC